MTCTKLNNLIQGLASYFTRYLGSTNASVAHSKPLKFIKEIAQGLKKTCLAPYESLFSFSRALALNLAGTDYVSTAAIMVI